MIMNSEGTDVISLKTTVNTTNSLLSTDDSTNSTATLESNSLTAITASLDSARTDSNYLSFFQTLSFVVSQTIYNMYQNIRSTKPYIDEIIYTTKPPSFSKTIPTTTSGRNDSTTISTQTYKSAPATDNTLSFFQTLSFFISSSFYNIYHNIVGNSYTVVLTESMPTPTTYQSIKISTSAKVVFSRQKHSQSNFFSNEESTTTENLGGLGKEVSSTSITSIPEQILENTTDINNGNILSLSRC